MVHLHKNLCSQPQHNLWFDFSVIPPSIFGLGILGCIPTVSPSCRRKMGSIKTRELQSKYLYLRQVWWQQCYTYERGNQWRSEHFTISRWLFLIISKVMCNHRPPNKLGKGCSKRRSCIISTSSPSDLQVIKSVKAVMYYSKSVFSFNIKAYKGDNTV